MNKGDGIFYGSLLLVLLALVGWWYSLNSDQFFRKTYYFRSVDGGGLAVGGRVLGNGVLIGEVRELTKGKGEGILIKAKINSNVSIGEATYTQIKSVGMVGHRVLDLQLEPESQKISEFDTLHCNFHPGPVHLVVFGRLMAKEMVLGFESLLKGFNGTILDSQNIEEIKKIKEGTLKTASRADKVLRKSKSLTINTLDSLLSSVNLVVKTIADLKPGSKKLKSDVNSLFADLEKWRESLLKIKKGLEPTIEKWNNHTGSISLLANDSIFHEEIDSMTVHLLGVVDTLLNGNIQLNVDLF